MLRRRRSAADRCFNCSVEQNHRWKIRIRAILLGAV